MNILLVDDEKDSRISVAKFLRKLGHQVLECASGEAALVEFERGYFPMILSDIKMPGISGLELLQAISGSTTGQETAVVLFTGHGDMQSAIEALRAGAYDYLLKPINIEELAIITEKIAEHLALQKENKILTERFTEEVKAATAETQQELSRLQRIAAQAIGLGEIGVFCHRMSQVILQAEKYHQDASMPVLIQGETGTGKEVIARMIHYGQEMTSLPFIDINCAALTPSLFESELFGYEGGAFTGGVSGGQKGKMDLAMGGTLFLDEVAEIPIELQGKLLRVIQEKEFYRVGGLKKVKTNFRIVCATNVSLEEQVENGKFRKDLYYRLKVGQIFLPPLRERLEEIIPLALLFLRNYAQQKKKRFLCISPAAEEILRAYHWPGNIRELKNTMEWVTFMYDEEEVQPGHLSIITQGAANEFISDKKVTSVPLNMHQIVLPEDSFSLDEFVE